MACPPYYQNQYVKYHFVVEQRYFAFGTWNAQRYISKSTLWHIDNAFAVDIRLKIQTHVFLQ